MIYSRHNHRIPMLLIGLVFALISCEKSTTRKNPPPRIQVVSVIQKDVPIYREFVGQVYGLVDIPIRSRVEGFLEGIHFEEGSKVEKGKLLYTIDAQPYLAEVTAQEGKVAEAQTYLINATNELERYKPLAEINAVSKSDLDAAQASKEAAEGSLKAAKANLELARINLSYTKISSPIDGFIGKTEARVGEFVGKSPNPVILNEVSNLERVRVQFFLTETEFLTLAKEMRNRLREKERSGEDRRTGREDQNVELILSDGSVYDFMGDIDFVDRGVDATTGSILVQASFPNPDDLLRPGMYAKVKVRFDIFENAILVPQRCVMELQGQYSVYTIGTDNAVKARQVVATDKIGDLWLIEKGLKVDDRVVIDGLQKVSTGMVVNPELTEFKSQSNG